MGDQDIRRWFLPESRAAITSTERVDSHVGTRNYYQRLAALIDRTNEGDELFFASWVMRPSTEVPSGGKSLSTLLDAAQQAGVLVKILLPDNPNFPKNTNIPAKRELDKIKVDARLDGQWNQGGTHHQKAVFLTVTEEGRRPRTEPVRHTPHFFCGGCDVAEVREQWCDAMVEIVGQGANLGATTLDERWMSVTGFGPAARFTPKVVNDHTFVQFVRTYPKPDEHAKDRKYAKAGETTVHDLLCHAIGLAERFIYIEDQYFFGSAQDPDEPKIQRLEELLKKKLSDNVTVVVVTTREDQMSNEGWDAPKRRARILRLLTDGLGKASDRFRIYQYKANMVEDGNGKVAGSDRNWVHTKAWVFDDDFAVVGSSNVNWPSYFYESELSAGIASKAPIAGGPFNNFVFAKALRMKLQMAHLNKTANSDVRADDVADWDAALKLLKGAKSPLEEMRKDKR